MRFSIAAVLAFAASALAADPTPGFSVITKPGQGESVPAGSAYDIVWSPSAEHPGTIKIGLLGGATPATLNVIDTIATGVDAAKGTYSWAVPSTLGDLATYGIIITLESDTDIFQYSFPFKIAGSDGGSASTTGGSASTSADASSSATGGSKPSSTGGAKTSSASSSSAAASSKASSTSAAPSSTVAPSSSSFIGNLSTTAGPSQTTITTFSTTTKPTSTKASTSSVATNGVASLAAGSFAVLGGVAMAVLAM